MSEYYIKDGNLRKHMEPTKEDLLAAIYFHNDFADFLYKNGLTKIDHQKDIPYGKVPDMEIKKDEKTICWLELELSHAYPFLEGTFERKSDYINIPNCLLITFARENNWHKNHIRAIESQNIDFVNKHKHGNLDDCFIHAKEQSFNIVDNYKFIEDWILEQVRKAGI